jgi:hypothetical protein
MYMGWVSVTGTMNVGVLEAVWRRLFLPRLRPLALPLPLPGAATGWKSEYMAFCSGWQGVFALEEATLWFYMVLVLAPRQVFGYARDLPG